jgi:hypothetical protein
MQTHGRGCVTRTSHLNKTYRTSRSRIRGWPGFLEEAGYANT